MITLNDAAPRPLQHAFNARLMRLLDDRCPGGENLEFSPASVIRALSLTDEQVLSLIADAGKETLTDPALYLDKLP
jgi:hypothetical protein